MYKTLVRKPERERSFGRRKHRWEDNIKTDIKDIRGNTVGGRGWIHLGEDSDRWRALLNKTINFRVPQRRVMS
jgi:hypothetical protein